MKRGTCRLRKQRLAQLALGTLLLGLMLTDAKSAPGGGTRPTPHELDAIAATPGPRLWYHEEEFGRDPALRAIPEQVVILHLEQVAKGGKPVRNTIPYLFAETADYTFCVPKDDPHIRSLELVREGSHGVVVHVPRSAPCKTRTIAAGLYQLDVEHDGAGIAAAGKKAFVHVPRFKRDLREGSVVGSFLSTCNDPTVGDYPQFAFTAPNGMFVDWGPDGDGNPIVQTKSPPVDAASGWSICPDGSGNYTFGQGDHGEPAFLAAGPPNADTRIHAEITSTPTKFALTDLGNFQFTLAANFRGTLYPIVVGSDNVLHWTAPGTTPTVFTTVLKFYNSLIDTTVLQLQLQPGEVALFQECNYAPPTWVFSANVPDFGAFRHFGVPLDGTVAAVKPGPQTFATLKNSSGTAPT